MPHIFPLDPVAELLLQLLEIGQHPTAEDALIRALCEVLPDGVVFARRSGEPETRNAEAVRILGPSLSGKQAEEWAQRTLVSEVRKDRSRPGSALPLAQALDGVKVPVREYLVRNPAHPEGLRLLAGAAPLMRQGEVAGALLMLRDLTTQRKAEQAREASLSRYQLVFHNNLAGMARTRIDGTFVECNLAFARMMGYDSPEECLATRGAQYYNDERERGVLVAELVKRRRIENRELQIRRKDGSPMWVLASIVWLPPQVGDVEGEILTTFVDISERRQWERTFRETQERFSTFMNNIPGVAFIRDRDGSYVYYNEGVSVREKGAPAPSAAPLSENDRAVLESGEPQEFLEVLTHSDGPHSWLISKFPIFDEEGEARMVGGIGIDVTDRMHLEEQLRQSQKMEAIGRLAGGIAHDFNNLITLMTGYGQMALDGLTNSQPAGRVKLFVEEMMHSAHRAAELTSQLLAFSRRQNVHQQNFELGEMVRNLERLLRPLAGEHVLLEIAVSQEPCVVRADPGQIEQVLMNLSVHSRDAMPEGGILRVKVSLERDHGLAEPSGPCVLLAVSDTAKGMDEVTRARLFEPFFSSKGKGKSGGLGLATVYGIVKQSGGEILVESEPGGNRFLIYLPLAGVVTGPEPEERATAELPVGSETILLVEDEANVRGLVQIMLTRLGYQVIEAADGQEALRIYKKEAGRIDLLLTDVIMPQMNGRELALRVEQLRPGMKVIYMSGYTDDMLVRQGVLAEDVILLQKPFTHPALARLVRRTLDAEAKSKGLLD